MQIDWGNLLVAFLHDPPDKALDIRGHERRACSYASIVADHSVSKEELHSTEDQLASTVERLPMPSPGPDGERAVSPVSGALDVIHPLSGAARKLGVGGVEQSQSAIEVALRDLAAEDNRSIKRFLKVWRLLPERLSDECPWLAQLPADTRVPDHTIWNHLNITAGLHAALVGNRGAALLSFSLGPVQQFIESARSVRDLWSGSMILSWLAFQAMLPVIKQFGPTAVVYPALHGSPLLDLWLAREDSLPLDPSLQARMSPCLPNRFLAVVPAELDADSMPIAQQCQESAQAAWTKMAGAVRSPLQRKFSQQWPNWDQRWDEQIENFFEMHTSMLPLRPCGDQTLVRLCGGDSFNERFPQVADVRRLAQAIPEAERPGYGQDSAGRWQLQVDLSARLMAAQRSVRHVPPPADEGPVPPKCSLLGSYEQMGPADLDESRRFWEAAQDNCSIDGVRLRPRERLCAVSLVKRFCGPAFFAGELGIDPQDLRFPDTATVAAAVWLDQARAAGRQLSPNAIRREYGDWSGQWLHWPAQDYDADESPVPDLLWKEIRAARSEQGLPPAYYAVLMMDGDEMSRWLKGEKSPSVREVLHPNMRYYFERLPETSAGLDARRPVGPALHAAISEALANFSLFIAPPIVQRHHGQLIYAGGDDVLALLPAASALKCALELRRAFSGDPQVNGGAAEGYCQHGGREMLTMGPRATCSAGVAIVHYKEDLRFALDAARRAEKAAKGAGRDALQVAVCRRSGEHTSVLCPWEFAGQVQDWVDAFQSGASDRWTYHLRSLLPTLKKLPTEAMDAELKRQVGRLESGSQHLLRVDARDSAAQALLASLGRYRELVTSNRRGFDEAKAFEEFLVLCQSASFLARGEGK